MSRRIRLALIAVFASITLSTAACSSFTGPSSECGGTQNSDTHC
jgi:hypothetical protein